MVPQLFQTWFRQVQQLWSEERVTRLRNLAWLLVGIYASRSVQLSKVAGTIPGLTQWVSRTRRLERFLGNSAVRVREWYSPIAQGWLRYLAETVGEIRLVVDGSQVGFGHQLLLMTVAYRRRVIPLVWTWVPYVKGHSSVLPQLTWDNSERQPPTEILLPPPHPDSPVTTPLDISERNGYLCLSFY